MSDSSPSSMHCANHPDRETNLRCNRCEKPICIQCAVLTPTGYRCKECIRGQQKVFDNALWIDFPVGMILAAGLTFLGSIFAPSMGFFTLFLSPIIGVIIAEAIRKANRRRRSKRLFQLITAASIMGGLPKIIIIILGFLPSALNLGGSLELFLPLIWQSLYLALLVPTLSFRISGIQI
jgi:hypothetical protein